MLRWSACDADFSWQRTDDFFFNFLIQQVLGFIIFFFSESLLPVPHRPDPVLADLLRGPLDRNVSLKSLSSCSLLSEREDKHKTKDSVNM